MSTLADINATLQMQTDAIGRQADAVTKSNEILDAVRQRLSDMLAVEQNALKESRRSDERARKKGIEDKRETTKPLAPKGFMAGFAQGTGFSWLSDFMSGTLGSLFGKGGALLGLLAGAIGKAAGKLLIFGLLGTAIVNYFGDELKIVADKIDEWFGIDLVTYFKNNPIMAAAATAATGAIAIAMSKLVARIAYRSAVALGAAGLSLLFPKAFPSGGPGTFATPKGTPKVVPEVIPKGSPKVVVPRGGPGTFTQPKLAGALGGIPLDKNGKALKGAALASRNAKLARLATSGMGATAAAGGIKTGLMAVGGTALRVLGSLPVLVAQLILEPSSLGDSTITGAQSKELEKVIGMLAQGGNSAIQAVKNDIRLNKTLIDAAPETEAAQALQWMLDANQQDMSNLAASVMRGRKEESPFSTKNLENPNAIRMKNGKAAPLASSGRDRQGISTIDRSLSTLPSTSGSTLATANMSAKATYLLKAGDTYITNPPAQQAQSAPSIMMQPVGTVDPNIYQDVIMRYGRR
jgi:hypothetical protein